MHDDNGSVVSITASSDGLSRGAARKGTDKLLRALDAQHPYPIIAGTTASRTAAPTEAFQLRTHAPGPTV